MQGFCIFHFYGSDKMQHINICAILLSEEKMVGCYTPWSTLGCTEKESLVFDMEQRPTKKLRPNTNPLQVTIDTTETVRASLQRKMVFNVRWRNNLCLGPQKCKLHTSGGVR